MSALLSTHDLIAGYGDMRALHGVEISVSAGETVALIGANGAGKSTLLKAIMGVLPVAQGMIRLDGKAVGGQSPHLMVKAGVAIVPEGRRLFVGMSVEENLRIAIEHAAEPMGEPWTLERVFALFPILREKARTLVENLSGGQQQMVSIGRSLLVQPRVLLCDEISLGLAPKVVREIYAALPEISAGGVALVLVEQDVGLAQRASQRLYCMLEGRITLQGASSDITREQISAAYFGATHVLD
ncbi:ABC transporter ATP-binding protein [Roseinatronobacter sp. S2]|uniref:ABC transporter ATP-binding protein n=1 Tax=Roseinatronobacter sp. S2 TaxID=3035471 RepID=UPI00240FCEB3|nr:ABC transporter ATP-binding protein [Roseinatronobacter sp. S2]WFE74809.1 ABC transporter ATP-binding protein [Roseinatronobacter sp. S2]